MHKYDQIRWMRFVPLAFVAVALPMALEMIPPNPIYGVRTAATMSSAETWYRANQWAGAASVGLGLLALFVNLGADRARRVTLDHKMWIVVVTPVVVTLGMVIAGFASA
jgi:uncharacterized membrane protein